MYAGREKVGTVVFLDDLLAQGFGDGFGFRVDAELFIDVAEMKGNGVDADLELISSGFVTVTFDEHFEQFFFLRCQVISGIFRRHEVLK